MDAIIFLKAISNLLFAALLFLAVAITGAFSLVVNILKGFGPVLGRRKMLLFRKK